MNDPINVRREDCGVVDNMRVWHVYNADTGEYVGSDQQSVEDAAKDNLNVTWTAQYVS